MNCDFLHDSQENQPRSLFYDSVLLLKLRKCLSIVIMLQAERCDGGDKIQYMCGKIQYVRTK